MKNFLLLLVIAFSLSSFTSLENGNTDELNDSLLTTTCTATVTYNGNVVATFTGVSSLSGALGEADACAQAGAAAQNYINGVNAAIKALGIL